MRILGWLRRAADVVRRVIGVPDYDTYIVHHRTAHPGRPPMSHEEFLRARLAERYDRPGSRCC